MFADYKSQVVHDYQVKRDAGTLSLRLSQPTPGQLKEECMAVCNERYHKKDEMALKAFFGQAGDKVTCLQAIDRCGIDKFRPLVNFLRRSTEETEYKNIELLAWLVDFKDRPFDFGKKYDLKIEDKPEAKSLEKKIEAGEEPSQEGGNTRLTQPVSDRRAPKFRERRAFITIILLVSICPGIYWVWHNKPAVIALSGQQACMYWAEDHYEPVPCNQKLENTLVIPIDSEKLNHLHKITRADTITTRSKGHVWYVKVNGNMEYYTSDGFYPLDLRLRLKPITDYIIWKYVSSIQHGLQASK